MKKTLLLSLICLATIACQQQKPTEKEKNDQVEMSETGPIADQAMVSCAHPIATKVGVSILKNGGNAVDAAVAVKFALAVVYPRAGNIGGGGFAIYRMKDGTTNALDFREKAPGAAHRDLYLDDDGNVIDGLSTQGHKAAGVPGSVDGILKLHAEYGTKPLAELIQPAIDIATNGFVITEKQSRAFNSKQEPFEQVNGADFFMVKEGGWKKGDTVKFTELGQTLTHIRDKGRDGFYDGVVADQIVAEMKRGNGLITKEDLKAYDSKWRTPLFGTYRGHKVISMPPPSSGGVALIQLLQGAEKYDIREMGHNTLQTIHLLTELERRVYADRATHLGDPDFYDVPVEMLLDPAYNKERFSSISLDKKTDSQEVKEGKVDVIESVQTTHFSVVDSEGNAVAITTTLNGSFGCKVYVEGAGFFLNNEMDDFSVKPGVPNQFGLVGGEANAIQAEKRMLSSMTPTIIEKDGQLKMVVGTPGGSTIITSVFQTILNVIDHDMTMQDAVNATRTHSQWLPDMILIEKRPIDQAVITGLEQMGHKIQRRTSMGRMDCILVREDGKLEGGADGSRGDNYAEGF